MHHPTARTVITRILSGEGFGSHAVALVQAAQLAEGNAQIPESTLNWILEQCLALPSDQAPTYAHPVNQQPVPADEAGLCAQLAPILSSLPVDLGAALGSLWALVQLWPHIAANERPQARALLINGLAAQRVEASAHLSTLQLRQFQRQVPTQFGEQRPSVAALRGILDAKDPLTAYCQLAEHLGITSELETLCWVMGSLMVQKIQVHHDRHNLLINCLFGTTVCERLAPYIPIDSLITLISQLNHRMWWIRHHGQLQPIITSLDQTQRPFQQAVLTGDISLAQRAARKLSAQQPGKFWEDCWLLVQDHSQRNVHDIRRILTVLDAVRWRAGDGLPSGDDAAAIGTLLAEDIWRHQPPRKATA